MSKKHTNLADRYAMQAARTKQKQTREFAPVPIAYRDLVPADVPAMARLSRQAFCADIAAEDFAGNLDREDGGFVLVAAAPDGAAVGYALVTFHAPGVAELSAVAVLQKFGGSGIGRELVRLAAERAASTGRVGHMILQCPRRLAPWYASLGWTVGARRIVGEGAVRHASSELTVMASYPITAWLDLPVKNAA